MHVKLIPSDAAFVLNQVQSGRFHGPAEVVGMALRMLRAVHGSKEFYDAYVRAEIQEALSDPGPGIPAEGVVERLRRRLEARYAYTYTVTLEPAEEGSYVVTCPTLGGLATQGETLEEALAMAVDAIEGHLEGLQKDGLPIPPSDEPLHERIRAQVTVQLEHPENP